jgi:hypothetical protein
MCVLLGPLYFMLDLKTYIYFYAFNSFIYLAKVYWGFHSVVAITFALQKFTPCLTESIWDKKQIVIKKHKLK